MKDTMKKNSFNSLWAMKCIKYPLIIIIFIVITCVISILINYLILCPKQFEFVGKDTDWLSFWPTYLSSFASFAMVFIAWWTLNKTQENWEKETRPLLYAEINQFFHTRVSAEVKDSKQMNDYRYMLIIENLGIRPASDVKLELRFIDGNDSLNKNSFYKKITDELNDIEVKNYTIKGKDKILITLLPVNEWQPTNTDSNFSDYDTFFQDFKKRKIAIRIQYNQKYEYKTILNINQANFLQTSNIEMLDYIRMSIDDLKECVSKLKNESAETPTNVD